MSPYHILYNVMGITYSKEFNHMLEIYISENSLQIHLGIAGIFESLSVQMMPRCPAG